MQHTVSPIFHNHAATGLSNGWSPFPVQAVAQILRGNGFNGLWWNASDEVGDKIRPGWYHVQEWEGMHLSSKCNNHGSVFSDLDSTSDKNHGISSLQSETKSWFILPTSWTTESKLNECNFSPQVVLCRESKIQHFMSLGSCVFFFCWGKIHQNPTRFKAITGDDAGALASL